MPISSSSQTSPPPSHSSKQQSQSFSQKATPYPNFPETPSTDEEKAARASYAKVMGSAVNPVLREGNSDRRAPKAVKDYAKKHPHSMGAWSQDSKTNVGTMAGLGDFFSNEKSVTIAADTKVKIEHISADGTHSLLKEPFALLEGEILDATFMSKSALTTFLDSQIAEAKLAGVLFSLHMKATMMKVSDPIIFGHCVKVFFKDVLALHEETLAPLGIDYNNGFGDLISKIESLPADKKAAIEADIATAYENGPDLAMVNSDKGITNLHVPSDVIIDASMPAMIRTSGQMWNTEGKQQDTLAVIPDSSYAGVYQTTIDFCRKNGALDPQTMGSVPNVGLMAKAAEEYGSHNKTFEIPSSGKVRITDASGKTLIEHTVEEGDIWRACQTKDASVQDWVKLAVNRARASETPAIFWLDEARAHDANIIGKVKTYLADHNTRWSRHLHHGTGRSLPENPRAHRQRRGHDLRHWKRPPRLPHRPLPYSRGRHLRENALHRPPHEGRRTLRDRRRRIRPEARRAVHQGKLPPLGLPR